MEIIIDLETSDLALLLDLNGKQAEVDDDHGEFDIDLACTIRAILRHANIGEFPSWAQLPEVHEKRGAATSQA